MMEDIHKFRVLNKLKSTYRMNSVDSRKESSAEHTWSALLLADFFLDRTQVKLDRLKVYELLLYHDVVEIEAGDTPFHPNVSREDKKFLEEKAMLVLSKKLPSPLGDRFVSLFTEFEEQSLPEAKFARMIDVLDAQIHELDYKEDWKGWSKSFIVENKGKYFEEFPVVKEAFYELIDFLVANGYLST